MGVPRIISMKPWRCVVGLNQPPNVRGAKRRQSNNRAASQTEDRDPQGHFSALKQKRNGGPDGAQSNCICRSCYRGVNSQMLYPARKMAESVLSVTEEL